MRAAGPIRFALTAALAAGLAGPGASPAARAEGTTRATNRDEVWTHPDSSAFAIHRIAMVPAVGYDEDVKAESLAETRLGLMLKRLPYAWRSTTSTRALVASVRGGDSLLAEVKRQSLNGLRVDSLTAVEVCRRARAGAVLSLRVEQWEQRKIEVQSSGTPMTTIKVSAALVDSTGRLLWTITGGETLEGIPYSPFDDRMSQLQGNPTTRAMGLAYQQRPGSEGAPPSPDQVLDALFARWHERFPRPPATTSR